MREGAAQARKRGDPPPGARREARTRVRCPDLRLHRVELQAQRREALVCGCQRRRDSGATVARVDDNVDVIEIGAEERTVIPSPVPRPPLNRGPGGSGKQKLPARSNEQGL